MSFNSDSLFLIRQLFYQGSFQAAINETSPLPSSLSNLEDRLKHVYSLRSHLALGLPAPAPPSEPLDNYPELRAAQAFAAYRAGEDKEGAVESLRDIVLEIEGDEDVARVAGIVKTLAAGVFWQEGETEEALSTLGAGTGVRDLECVALLMQIYLSLSRTDLARAEYQRAKFWAEDAPLLQITEGWLGLATGGEGYQQAYYVFDEIASLPSANNATTLVSKAVAHATQGHWDEAEADLNEALVIDSNNANALANSIAVATHAGKSADAFVSRLEAVAPEHPLLVDLKAKSDAFDAAAAKFAVASA